MILLAGFLFTVLIITLTSLLGFPLYMYFNFVCFMIILMPIIFYLGITKSGKTLGNYIKASFKKNHAFYISELENIATVARNVMKITLAAGGFGFVTGFLSILATLTNQEQIGPALAISLISALYSISVSYFIFFPLQAWAENKLKNIGG